MPATRRAAIPVLATLVLAAAVAPASAQEGFLFGEPTASITVRGGTMHYRAKGDLFTEIRQELTLDRGDFRAPALGADAAIFVSPRLDIALGVSWARIESRSEFRDWVDQDDQPIEQVTRLRTVPVALAVRYYLLPRGAEISELAWIPRRTTPYVGLGAGLTWFRLEQEGDFVNFEDNTVITAMLEDSGNPLVVHVVAGVDYWFAPRLALNAEARYTHGSALPGLTSSFGSFNRIDLSGVQATLGLAFRR